VAVALIAGAALYVIQPWSSDDSGIKLSSATTEPSATSGPTRPPASGPRTTAAATTGGGGPSTPAQLAATIPTPAQLAILSKPDIPGSWSVVGTADSTDYPLRKTTCLPAPGEETWAQAKLVYADGSDIKHGYGLGGAIRFASAAAARHFVDTHRDPAYAACMKDRTTEEFGILTSGGTLVSPATMTPLLTATAPADVDDVGYRYQGKFHSEYGDCVGFDDMFWRQVGATVATLEISTCGTPFDAPTEWRLLDGQARALQDL
jgi:hypothetical protein